MRISSDSPQFLCCHFEPGLDPNRHPLPILHLVCGLLHIKRHAKRKAKGNREMLSEATASGNDRLRIYPDRQEAWIKKIVLWPLLRWFGLLLPDILIKIGDTELINFSKVSRIRKMILEDDKGKYCPTVEESRVLENVNVTTGFNLLYAEPQWLLLKRHLPRTLPKQIHQIFLWAWEKKKASEYDQKGSIYSWHSEIF